MGILDQNLLTLDFWQKSVTYGGHAVPAGSIGCAALNITDEQIAQLAQYCMPLSMIVAAFGSGTLTADVFPIAEKSILEITKLLRKTPPFSYIDYPEDGHDVHIIFSKERADNALAYAEAITRTGAAASFDEQYKYGVGIFKLISIMAQLAGNLQIYKQSMTAFADALHDSGRTPDDYAAVFAQHFSDTLDFSFNDPSWMSLTNITAQYASAVMSERETPQLVKRMHYVSFLGMFRSDLFEGLCVGHAPRKCPICGKWFLTTDARHTKYCGGLASGDKRGRTCRQVGNLQGRRNRELAADHPIKAIYEKRMNTITQYLRRGTIEPQIAEKMKFIGKNKMQRALSDSVYAQTEYASEMEHAALMEEAKGSI